MSIGFNPHYGNSEKTAEPWLLHTFEQVHPQISWLSSWKLAAARRPPASRAVAPPWP
jgi:hypothetical protein